ncbi:hypothetical protein BC629DRAFT_347749 [Irpex lacteus]|nr:hypothetical protein BC629DRAFT_347749 [Irpex lacteus]
MDGKTLGGSLIAVSYEEPDAQHVFRRPRASNVDSADKLGTGTTDVPRAGPLAEKLRREALMRELKDSTERQAREASAREAAEAKVKRRQEQLLRREQAECVHARAKEELEAAMAKRRCACKGVVLAKQAQETADQELAGARDACAEAKRVWLEAMDREAKTEQQATIARKITNEALRWREILGANVDAAKQEEKASRTKKEKLAHELAEDELDEETLRLAELAESIRRMQELRMLDLAEEKEKARKEQAAEEQMRREKHAAEEKSKLEREETARQEREEAARREREEVARKEREEAARREREEAERLAQEKLKREEQARRDAETRKRRYEQAVRAEQLRCRMGDLEFCRSSTADQWNEQRALERFKFFSDDFDTIKFQESQPLTFESVPWPILAQPREMNFDAIDWGAVEQFFNVIEKLMPNKAEHKTFLAKAHRRFHPDKWKARGILGSVLDDKLRGQLETAGNVVAQAITPLWLKSRQL